MEPGQGGTQVAKVKSSLGGGDDGGDGNDVGDGGDGGDDGGDGRMVRSNVKKFIRVRAPIQVESSALRF